MDESQTKELQKALEAELIESAQEAKRIGYTPTAFFGMLAKNGGYESAKRLINTPKHSEGFVKLWEKGRLDLTVEAVILKQKYAALFKKEERDIAKERLEQYGFDANKLLDSSDEPTNLELLEFNQEKFKAELSSRNYIVGVDTRYYIVTVKISPYNTEINGNYKYSILVLDNHMVVREDKIESDSRNILTASKEIGIEQLIKLNPKVLLNDITMVHYKQDRNSGNPWQKDSKEVLEELFNKHKVKIVMENLLSQSEKDIDSEKAEDDEYYEDGAIKYYYGKRYERNPINRAKAIAIHGLTCKGCGFDFYKAYGKRGQDFIEVHHIYPLSLTKEAKEIDPETDLTTLCSNCHHIVHREKENVLSIEELKSIVKVRHSYDE